MADFPDPDSLARLLRRRAAAGPLVLPARGASMGRQLTADERVVIDTWDRPRIGQVWAFVSDEGEVVVHRIRSLDGDRVTARGVGNDRDDPPVGRHRLIGPVVGRIRPDGSEVGFGHVDRWRSVVAFQLRGWARRTARALGAVVAAGWVDLPR